MQGRHTGTIDDLYLTFQFQQKERADQVSSSHTLVQQRFLVTWTMPVDIRRRLDQGVQQSGGFEGLLSSHQRRDMRLPIVNHWNPLLFDVFRLQKRFASSAVAIRLNTHRIGHRKFKNFRVRLEVSNARHQQDKLRFQCIKLQRPHF